jgi:hypothetical protein
MAFNEVVQIDLFNYGGKLYLLTIDEATRYKIATLCQGRELKHILNALMNSWIRYFGPMRTLVSDQETSLMTVAAGVELQRLGIARQPGGTTSGVQGIHQLAWWRSTSISSSWGWPNFRPKLDVGAWRLREKNLPVKPAWLRTQHTR